MNEMTATNVLPALLLCGLAGMVGQGIRAVIGLNKSGDLEAGKLAHMHFNATYLLVTLMIGFIAGCLSGIIIGINDFIHRIEVDKLFAVVSAGYAGVDFIEGSLNLIIKQPSSPSASPRDEVNKKQTASPLQRTTPDNVFPANPAPQLTGGSENSTTLLSNALQQLSSGADYKLWAPILDKAFSAWAINTNRRKAAAIGQFMVEAGPALNQLEENLNYGSAQQIMLTFPTHFNNEQEAKAFCHQPEKLANRVYANRMGNGPEASGDGYRYRGRGLIQLTGKNMYQQFANESKMTLEEAVIFCSTPEGAAQSACWYLKSNDCLPLADKWDLISLSRKVNGWEVINKGERFEYSERMLAALEKDR